jgi:tetratricopeptide (TPR) repeat protein
VASSAHVLGWAPLVAESELALGSTLAIVFEHKRAQQALERAVIAALAGNDDRSLAEALLEQVKYSPASQVDQARAELARAKAVIDRLGDPTLEIRALVAESRLEGTADRMPRALEVATEAIAVAEERLGGDALETAEAHEHLAGLLSWAGRPIDAEPHARKALDGKRRLLGPKHSDLIQTLSIVGDIAATGGHPEDAVSALREARAVAEAAYGPDHVQVANALMLESGVLAQGGRLDDAIATIERARAIRRVRQASTDNLVVIDQIQYGWILLQAGRNERAAEELAAGVAILDASGELESELHARTVSALFSQLATAHARVGRRRESLAALDRVLRMPEGTNPATRSRRVDVLIDAASWHLTFGDPRVAIGYVREARRVAGEVDTKDEWWEVDIAKNLGRGYLAIDRPKHALAELEPTLKAVERDDPGARERSPSVKFSLARALDGAGGDRARAGALARQAFAERELAHVDPAEYPTKREIERWLARDPATGHRSASDEH